MTNQSGVDGLLRAVREYFDLMYASDVSRFDRVFRPTAQLHGLRDGKMRMLTAQAYREILATAPSPQCSIDSSLMPCFWHSAASSFSTSFL